MGYIYLVIAKIASIFKMMAVKKCGNIASGPKNSLRINLLRALGCIAVGSIVCLFSGYKGMDSEGVWIAILSGTSNGVLLFAWVLAAACAPMYFVEIFCMIGGVIFPLLLSPILFDAESVTLIQWCGTAALFIAVALLSKRSTGKRLTLKSILIMIVAGIGNMGMMMSQKMYAAFSDSAVADFQLVSDVAMACVLFLALLVATLIGNRATADGASPAPQAKFTGKVLIFIGIAIVMMYSSQVLSTMAAGRLSSMFYPLSYVFAMPLVFLTDVIVYKEKVTVRNIIGILLITASGILINL